MDNFAFVGFVPLGSPIMISILTTLADVPTNSAVTPSYRVYGNAGFMSGQSGPLSALESGAITNATNTAPIVITSANHSLTDGMVVTVASVTGNTAANGTRTITVLTPDTFSLNGSTGNSGYTGGGTWTTTGLYNASITPTQGDGYAQGLFYDVLISANIGGNTVEFLRRFGVI